MNKQALLVGCGSKFGEKLLSALLRQGWGVNSISSSLIEDDTDNLNQLVVDWQTINSATIERFLRALPDQNIVFFNQNSSALTANSFSPGAYGTTELWKQEKHWSQAYYVSCVLPFHIIHTLGSKCNSNTKVGWMLSSLVHRHRPSDIGTADYIGNKYQNFMVMKNFSLNHPGCFYGVDPKSLEHTGTSDTAALFLNLVINSNRNALNGKVVGFDLNEELRFKLFDNAEN